MKRKRFLVLLLTLAIVISQVPVSVFAKSDRLPEREHEEFDFSSLKYVHLEENEVKQIESKLNEISELSTDENNKEEIKRILYWHSTEVNSYLNDLMFVAYVNYMMYSYDEYWVNEYKYIQQIFNEIISVYYYNCSVLSRSECKDALTDIYGEGAIEYFSDTTVTVSEDDSLISEINQLVSEFFEYNPQVEYNGTTYSEESAFYAYWDGEISYEESEMIKEKINEVAEVEYTDLYFRIIQKYNALAKRYGYDNYLEYAYKEIYSRDITPDKAVKEGNIVLKGLAPYQLTFSAYDCDRINEEANSIIGDDSLMLLGVLAEKIAPELKESYDYLIDSNGCFFAPEDSPVNPFVNSFWNIPYICMKDEYQKLSVMNALIHEFGHYNMDYWKSSNASDNTDLQEIYSQGLEMLASKYYDSIYGDFAEIAEGNRLGTSLDSIYNTYVNILIEYQAFSGNYETAAELLDAIRSVTEKCYAGTKNRWYQYMHFYTFPGYFYSYVSAYLSVLELYVLSKENYEAAIDSYIKLISNYELPTKKAKKGAGLTTNWTKSKLTKLFNTCLSLYLEYDPPVIEGVEDGGVYTEAKIIHVIDKSKVRIQYTQNDETIDHELETFDICYSNTPIKLLATDGFGNSTEIEFIIEPTPFLVKTEFNEEGKHVLSWGRFNNPTRYIVYGAPLGEKFKKLAILDGSQKSFVNKDSDNRTWKYYVLELFDYLDGTTVKMASSKKSLIVSNENAKYTNVKSVEIEGDEEITLKKGQSLKLPVKITSENEEKKLYSSKKHKKLEWKSTNTNVVNVKNGKITALSEGTCYVYVYTLNGCRDRIIVHVE